MQNNFDNRPSSYALLAYNKFGQIVSGLPLDVMLRMTDDLRECQLVVSPWYTDGIISSGVLPRLDLLLGASGYADGSFLDFSNPAGTPRVSIEFFVMDGAGAVVKEIGGSGAVACWISTSQALEVIEVSMRENGTFRTDRKFRYDAIKKDGSKNVIETEDCCIFGGRYLLAGGRYEGEFWWCLFPLYNEMGGVADIGEAVTFPFPLQSSSPAGDRCGGGGGGGRRICGSTRWTARASWSPRKVVARASTTGAQGSPERLGHRDVPRVRIRPSGRG